MLFTENKTILVFHNLLNLLPAAGSCLQIFSVWGTPHFLAMYEAVGPVVN